MVKKENFYLFVSYLFAVIWFIDGLILNLLQFLCYLLIRPISKNLYRKLNYYLTYSSWAQVVAWSEYWANCKLTVYYADEETREHFGKEHCMTLLNHKYDVDWLYCWIFCDKLYNLGSAKTFAKKDLRWAPVIGWGWIFCEMIFLSRSWDKDSLILGESLDRLMEYSEIITLLLFAEGTRFTPEKYQNSVNYCREKGLQALKHHLYPRTRGFVFTIHRVQDTMPAVYNIQLAFPEDQTPTLMDILKGKSFHGHMYCERIPVVKIPKDSEESTANFLLDVYKQKDELVNFFNKNGHFPGASSTLQRRKSSILHVIFWSFSIPISLFYLTYNLYNLECYKILALVLFLLLIVLIAIYILIRSTKAKKGSSYGSSSSSSNGSSTSTSNPKLSETGDSGVRKRHVNETLSSSE